MIFRPAMILCGASAYPRTIDFAGFRAIADEVGSAKNFKMIERGLHEVPFPCPFFTVVHVVGICTYSREQTTSAGTVYSTGLGFQANIVEECVLLSALLHIFAGLKKTWDQKLSSGLMSGSIESSSWWTSLTSRDSLSRSNIPLPSSIATWSRRRCTSRCVVRGRG